MFEVLMMLTDGSHAGTCGCEPCITVRAVLQRTGALIRMPGEKSRL